MAIRYGTYMHSYVGKILSYAKFYATYMHGNWYFYNREVELRLSDLTSLRQKYTETVFHYLR
jgi:hypothetical protein